METGVFETAEEERTLAMRDADTFLRIRSDFSLGHLKTEGFHPLTEKLSQTVCHDTAQGLALLHAVDVGALSVLTERFEEIEKLKAAIKDSLAVDGRIFLYGCGATGRLSLALGELWRREKPEKAEAIVDFMTGGDVAMVRSIEGCEDYEEHGRHQLEALGFERGDLLIACTEGGETSSVIGAVKRASTLSEHPPYFLYCNDNDDLKTIARSQKVLENNLIQKISLPTGPQALSGSTRMQASTILMLAVGMALFDHNRDDLVRFIDYYESLDLSGLAEMTETESQAYLAQKHTIYIGDEHTGMAVLTDTTERAPTFNLTPFENALNDYANPSETNFTFNRDARPQDSWFYLLKRRPVTHEWPSLNGLASRERLLGFSFNEANKTRRDQAFGEGNHRSVHVESRSDKRGFNFSLDNACFDLDTKDMPPLFRDAALKMVMNMHSTALMGRIGRYENNMMVWVSPANLKLIDRATRYARNLLDKDGIEASYEDTLRALYDEKANLDAGESVVMRTVDALRKSSRCPEGSLPALCAPSYDPA